MGRRKFGNEARRCGSWRPCIMAPMAIYHREKPPIHRLARLVLVAFLFTFMASRVLVFLIMSRRVPDLYVHVGGTHIHHLNYGIFLLAGVGAYLVFIRPAGQRLSVAAAIYGIGLALTFDEFGMWLHLGGPYWQRASFDAIVVIAAALSLVAVAPLLRQFRRKHWSVLLALMILGIIFGTLLWQSIDRSAKRLLPRLQEIEMQAPP